MFQEILNSFPNSLIMTIGIFLITKNLLQNKTHHNYYFKLVIIIIMIILLDILVPSNCNNTIKSIITIMFISIAIKIIFNTDVTSTIVAGAATSIIMTISKIIIIFISYILNNIALTNMINPLISDVFIVIFGLLLSKIKYVPHLINKFISGTKLNKFEVMLLFFLTFTIAFFNYQIFIIRYVKGNSINLIIYVIVFSLLFFVYIYDRIKFKELKKQYKSLLEYSCTFEEELDKDKLTRHEYKNQMIIIRSMTKNKKVIEYINGIIKNIDYDSNFYIRGINNLPTGGIRGLIYYKLMIMKHNNIYFSLDVDKNINKKILKLSKDELQVLNYIIGVCTDNAIEESLKKENSNISIEIYSIFKEINFVISNTINEKVNLQKVGIKGYTTKGKGHGSGLYLVKKFLNNYPNITINCKVINNYFVQEIKIRVM